MHFHHNAVGSACGGGHCHGRHKAGHAGGVAGVNYNGKVSELVQYWYGGEVKGVSGVGLKCPYASLAENYVLAVSYTHLVRLSSKSWPKRKQV